MIVSIKTYLVEDHAPASTLPRHVPEHWAQRLVEAAQEPKTLRMHKIDAIIDQMCAAGLIAPRAKWLSDGLKLAHEAPVK